MYWYDYAIAVVSSIILGAVSSSVEIGVFVYFLSIAFSALFNIAEHTKELSKKGRGF